MGRRSRKKREARELTAEQKQMGLRAKLVNAMREADLPPADALGVVTALLGTMAATLDAGKRRTAKAVKQAYVMEKKRLLGEKIR